MYVRYEKPADSIGNEPLAIVQHGYSGSMDQPHIRAIAETFRRHGFPTLSLDATHSFNASDGNLEDSSILTHLHDLEDCIGWAKGQTWYREPFALAGQSLGGYTVLHYAEEHPEEISLLFPCSAVTTGKKLAEAFERNLPGTIFSDWKNKGFQEIESWDGSGKRGRRPFSWLTGMAGYDAYENIEKLTMPVLMVVGSNDIPTPPDHQLMFYNLLPEPKEMHIIPGSDHSFSEAPHREKMAEILGKWIEKNR